ncbi:hypothetical protein GGF46_003211, partial [Coemansia sp. RSA 552]
MNLQETIDLTADSASDHEARTAQVGSGTRQRGGKKSKKRIRAIGQFIRGHIAGNATRSNFSVGHLRDAARLQSDNSTIVLCSPETQLFNSTAASRGWACGYRNCQMLISSLLSAPGGSRLSIDNVPSVSELQHMLESAWAAGFDPDGAQQLNHRVSGTRKWIGATEVYCILAHLGIHAHIVDFHHPTGADGTHPGLFAYVVNYFTSGPGTGGAGGSNTMRFTEKHPLYLQHQGHSRTIIGVELAPSATCLLVLDPDLGVAPAELQISMFRLPLADTRRATQYQLVY